MAVSVRRAPEKAVRAAPPATPTTRASTTIVRAFPRSSARTRAHTAVMRRPSRIAAAGCLRDSWCHFPAIAQTPRGRGTARAAQG